MSDMETLMAARGGEGLRRTLGKIAIIQNEFRGRIHCVKSQKNVLTLQLPPCSLAVCHAHSPPELGNMYGVQRRSTGKQNRARPHHSTVTSAGDPAGLDSRDRGTCDATLIS